MQHLILSALLAPAFIKLTLEQWVAFVLVMCLMSLLATVFGNILQYILENLFLKALNSRQKWAIIYWILFQGRAAHVSLLNLLEEILLVLIWDMKKPEENA